MIKCRCENGEIVEIDDIQRKDKYILVHYKGKVYRREMGVIGRKLFLIDANLEIKLKANNGHHVKIGSIVCVESKNGIENFRICGTEIEKVYTRMGGSYYGSKVIVRTIGKQIKENDDGNTISCLSPIGAALLNKTVGDIVRVQLPDGSIEEYLILKIR